MTSGSLSNQPVAKSPPRADWWVFDVDGCLVDSLTGTSLRPGAVELLSQLVIESRVILWSAGGADYARARARQFLLGGHVSGCFAKDGRDANGHYLTGHLEVTPDRAVFVDDRPEDLSPELEVVAVSPYLAEDPYDHALEAVARWAGLRGSIPNMEDRASRCLGMAAPVVRESSHEGSKPPPTTTGPETPGFRL